MTSYRIGTNVIIYVIDCEQKVTINNYDVGLFGSENEIYGLDWIGLFSHRGNNRKDNNQIFVLLLYAESTCIRRLNVFEVTWSYDIGIMDTCRDCPS